MRSGRSFEVFSISFVFLMFFLTFKELTVVRRDPHCLTIIISSQFFPGAGKRALRFALIPPPDPHPLSLTLSICAKPWRASIPVGPRRGKKNINWAKFSYWWRNISAQQTIYPKRRSPIQIKCRQAFALLKGVCGSKGMGPRGRGRGRIATPWPLPRV